MGGARGSIRIWREVAISRQTSWRNTSPSLAHQRRLFEGDEDGAHPGNVLGLLAGLGVEVAQVGHPLPLRARAVVIRVGQESFLRGSAGTDGG